MALTGTIVANLIANATKFSGPMKKAAQDVSTLEKRMKSLQTAAKFSLSLVGVQKFGNFVKNSVADALKSGSDLQKVLDGRTVAAAEKLSDSFGKIKIGVQAATLETLNNFIPALDKASELAESIGRRISGSGLTKAGAEIAAARSARRGQSTTAIDELQRVRGELSRLERAKPQIEPGWHLPVTKAEVNNRAAIRKAQLDTMRLEIKTLESNAKVEAIRNLLTTGLLNIGNQRFGDLARGGDFLRQSFIGNRGEHLLATLLGNRTSTLFGLQRVGSKLGGFASETFGPLQQGAEFFGKQLIGPLGPLGSLAARIQGTFRLFTTQAQKFDSPIANLVQQLREDRITGDIRRPGAFERGREDTLEEIFRIMQADRAESGEDLPELIQVAKDQLEEQQRMAENIARALRGQLPIPARF